MRTWHPPLSSHSVLLTPLGWVDRCAAFDRPDQLDVDAVRVDQVDDTGLIFTRPGTTRRDLGQKRRALFFQQAVIYSPNLNSALNATPALITSFIQWLQGKP